MAKTVLEFEKPIVELENKIEEMKKYQNSLDISDEIKSLEEKEMFHFREVNLRFGQLLLFMR